jgi:hypothetical protein
MGPAKLMKAFEARQFGAITHLDIGHDYRSLF